ncbi:formin-like protein 18 [Panthera leo]|uniref:formin-like protein 18 n=1 Tax=Panthera leo TaxID=9689 RepID=UPI001C69AE57|nr:formin-like protein 18 [Panthera leo]
MLLFTPKGSWGQAEPTERMDGRGGSGRGLPPLPVSPTGARAASANDGHTQTRTPPRMVTQPLPQPRGRRSWHKAHGHCPPHPHPAGGPGRPGGPCIPLSPPEETQAWDQPPERPAEPANLGGVQTHLDGNIWPRAPAGQCLHKTPGPICKGPGWPLAQDPSARVTTPLEGRQLSQPPGPRLLRLPVPTHLPPRAAGL